MIDEVLRAAGRVVEGRRVHVDSQPVIERGEHLLENGRAGPGRVRPSRFVEPITCPVRIPPPARIPQATCGQWSRPPIGLIRGVRPNSPQTTTETSLSRPRLRADPRRAGRHSLVEHRQVVAGILEVRAVRHPASTASPSVP